MSYRGTSGREKNGESGGARARKLRQVLRGDEEENME